MKKINNKLTTILLTLNIIGLILILTKKLDCSIIKWLLLTLTIILPKILRKLKISIKNSIEMMYLILIFLSFTLGRIYNLYDKINWYDTLVHFISGIIIFIFGLIVLKEFKKYDKKISFNILFSILMTLSLAVTWEFVEFGIDKIFKTEMQDVLKTGVDDTMKDIFAALISSTLISIMYIYETKKSKKGLITKLIS